MTALSPLDAPLALPAVMPAQGVIDTGTTLATDIKNLLLVVATAVIGWLVLKFLIKAGTFTSALVAIIAGLVLFWALNNIQNPSIQQPLDDTVNEYGISAIPAPGVGETP